MSRRSQSDPRPPATAPDLPRLREEFRAEPAKPAVPTRLKSHSIPFRILRWFLLAGLLTTLAGLGGVYAALDSIIGELPPSEYLEEYRPPVPSRVLAADGSLVGEVFGEAQKRSVVTLDQFPAHLINALVALEDKSFFTHPGIDPVGGVRAALVNFQQGRITQGASTVSMLLAKDLYVIGEIEGGRSRTWEQKARETIRALQIERKYGKGEILERFLNQVNFGGNLQGVGEAARHYFGKQVTDLNLKECATLIGMLRGTTIYNPLRNPERAQARLVVTLNAMLDEGFITPEEFEHARDTPLALHGTSTRARQVSVYPYVHEYARHAFDTKRLYKGPDGRPIMLQGTGYDVRTTIDPHLQKSAEEALRWGLREHEKNRRYQHGHRWGAEDYAWVNGHTPGTIQPEVLYDAKIIDATKSVDTVLVSLPRVIGGAGPFEVDIPADNWLREFGALQPDHYITVQLSRTATPNTPRFVLSSEKHVQGALIAIQPSTGRILAMVGGYDFHDRKNSGNFNRVTQLHKQPGSAFKPLLYAAAVCVAGYGPATVLVDEEHTYGKGELAWTPSNFDRIYRGRSTMAYALAESLNASSVHLLDTFTGSRVRGVRTLHQFCSKKLGVNVNGTHDLTLAIGTEDMTPLDMAKAYSVFASGGWLREPYLIERVSERRRDEHHVVRTLYGIKDDPTRAKAVRTMDSRDAALISDLLRGAALHGTAKELSQEFDVPLAGKTGTTDSCEAAWFAGFGDDLVCIVYVGFDKRRSLGYKMTGSKVALPIWKRFMHAAVDLHPELLGEFEIPAGMVEMRITNLTGQRVTEGMQVPVDEEEISVLLRGDRLPDYGDPLRRDRSLRNLEQDVQSILDTRAARIAVSARSPLWTPDLSRLESVRRTPNESRPQDEAIDARAARDPLFVPDAAARDLRTILSKPTPTATPKPARRPWWRRGR